MNSITTFWYGLAGLCVVLVLSKVIQIIQNAFFSPLSKVPGPWWSAATGLPTKVAILSKQQVHFYHALHQKYGPFVRTAPNEIIVADVPTFKEIHKIGTHFVKSDFYKYLNPTEPGKGPFSVFALTDVAEHSKRRRLLSRGFTQSFLRSNWEPIVHEKVAFTVQRMKEISIQDGEVDILRWWTFMTSDIISQLMFGESFDSLKLGHKTDWFDAALQGTIASAMAWHFPLLYQVLKRIPLPAIQQMFSSHERLFARGEKAVENSKSSASSKNIFANVLEQAEKDNATMTDRDIIVEAGAFNIAGTDTTSNSLSFLVWCVLSDSSLQKALEAEVAGLEEPMSDEKLETLPVLNAVIKETLRLYGAAPGALPRITPAGGAKLGDYFVPGGTTVSTQAWTMHRDPALFENPERFDHNRWLSSTPMSDDAKVAFTPFGAGGRICLGIHLAYMELRLGTALFFRECRGAKLAPSTTPESMEVENIFLVAPKAGKCKVEIPRS